MGQRLSPAFRNVLVSAAFLAIAAFALAANLQGRVGPAGLSEVTAKLVEWSVLGSQRPLLRFRLEGNRADFRLDPTYFRKALETHVPQEFREGARVTVTARRTELLSPSTPLLIDTEIVWVRGIKVDGKVVVEPELLQRLDSADDRWGYGLLVLSTGCLVYSLLKWQRSRLRPNKSLERARER